MMTNKWIPHLHLCVLKALRHEVNRLVGLVLIRLHCRLLGVERTVLGLIGQSVLERQHKSETESDTERLMDM